MVKFCKWCGVEKPLTAFHKKPNGQSGVRNKCITCTLEYERNRRKDTEMGARIREYDNNRINKEERNEATKERNNAAWKTETGKARLKGYSAKWQKNNPEKRKAQHALGNAIRDKKVIRSPICEHCGSIENIQGHHWSYLEEHWLNVVWLCVKCHAAEHVRLRSLGIDPDI